jgi:UDP-N-acetylmuramate dehydrogenase
MTDRWDKLAQRLAAAADGPVVRDRPLAPFTSYGIGGPTAVWAAPRTEEGLRRVLAAVHAAAAPLFVLGRGTNLLVSDRGWPGVTLWIGDNLSGVDFNGDVAEARAGTRLADLIHAAARRGLGGLELLSGIPGGVGGALRMNAGAFGKEIAAAVEAVRGFTRDGTPFELPREAIAFGYRRAPELATAVITAARFRFAPEAAQVLAGRMEDTLRLRAERQPLDHPSCGSVFKRPPGYFAGALIESAGLKGERIGGAQVSAKHAGFVLNVGGATAADVYRLIRRIESRVAERFGVVLEREVQLIGEFPE